MGQYTEEGQSVTKTPIPVNNPQVVRIIQPDHPLFDQIVPVLRAITSRGAAVPRWVIVHPDGSTLTIPQVWATTDTDPSAPCPTPPPLPVDVPSLLVLAKLVQQILATPFQA